MIRRSKNKKKVKFNRCNKKKKENITNTTNTQIITKPLGGFLPFPPKNCINKKHFITHNGVTWVDLSLGHNCPDLKECIIRSNHLQKLKELRKERTKECLK